MTIRRKPNLSPEMNAALDDLEKAREYFLITLEGNMGTELLCTCRWFDFDTVIVDPNCLAKSHGIPKAVIRTLEEVQRIKFDPKELVMRWWDAVPAFQRYRVLEQLFPHETVFMLKKLKAFSYSDLPAEIQQAITKVGETLMADKTKFSSSEIQAGADQSTKKALHPKRCETCAHFDAPERGRDTGLCVANYPVVVPTGTVMGGQIGCVSLFPAMRPEQRCGKWEDPQLGLKLE